MTSFQKVILVILLVVAMFVIILFSTILYMVVNEKKPTQEVQVVPTVTVTRIELPTKVGPTATAKIELPTRVPPTATTTELPTKVILTAMPKKQDVQLTYYLTIFGSNSVTVSDALGRVPNVSTYITGDYAQTMVLPVGVPLTITLKTHTFPVDITLEKGDGVTAIQTVRYQDLALPANVMVILTLPFQDVSLRHDKDNDNIFESVVSPTVNVTDIKAVDTTPPTVTIKTDSANFITITAEDNESGVKILLYSFDKHTFLPYTSPFQIDPSKISAVYTLADDNLGNRSNLGTYLVTK